MFQAIPRLDINRSQTPLMCYYKSKESFLFYHFDQNKLHHNQELPKQNKCLGRVVLC
jgi:hypothetical protein